jgi:DNA-binding transcriptional MerR regulator
MTRESAPDPRRAMDKSPDAFRTISEVGEDLDLPQHVLRFWETRFAQIKPLKRGGGRRYYRPEDVDLLRGIRHLLYGEGYTIKGVQRILKEDGIRFVQAIGRGEQSVVPPAPGASAADSDAETEEAEIALLAQQTMGGSDSGLGRFSPLEISASTAAPKAAAQLPSTDDVNRLKAALHELAECARVLSALKAVDELAGSDEPGR